MYVSYILILLLHTPFAFDIFVFDPNPDVIRAILLQCNALCATILRTSVK
jgi:hypothetical protein